MNSYPTTKIKLIKRIEGNIGMKFNMLTIVSFSKLHSNGGYMYNCHCDCGNNCIALISAITRGTTKSCGCLKKVSFRKAIETNRVHGESHTKLHIAWVNMLDRCGNPNSIGYHNYGGRGISVCNEWKEYMPFRKWALENGHTLKLTLDRIDVNGNYEPSNCRWITQKEQMSNRRITIFLTYNNTTLSLTQWSEILNIKPMTIRGRLKKGWDVEKTFNTLPRADNRWKGIGKGAKTILQNI